MIHFLRSWGSSGMSMPVFLTIYVRAVYHTIRRTCEIRAKRNLRTILSHVLRWDRLSCLWIFEHLDVHTQLLAFGANSSESHDRANLTCSLSRSDGTGQQSWTTDFPQGQVCSLPFANNPLILSSISFFPLLDQATHGNLGSISQRHRLISGTGSEGGGPIGQEAATSVTTIRS